MVVNPMELLALIKQGNNPQQLMMSILANKASNNPMLANVLSLAKANNTQGIQQVVRNAAKQKGMDFDKQFSAFKKMLGV